MTPEVSKSGRGWPRAAWLFAAVLATSVLQPGVLVAVPLLVLLGLKRIRGTSVLLLTTGAMLLAIVGPRDSLWFVERAWALMIGGLFVSVTMVMPKWALSTRSLVSVLAATGFGALMLAVQGTAWSAIDWSMTDRLRAGFATWMDAMVVLRQGEAVSPALASAIYQMVEAQTAVFPAMIGLQSMAALGLAWWLYTRVVRGSDQGVGPLGGFRFNDHLVWFMIVGLLLLATSAGSTLTRVGANVTVFMGALYALRGVGVVLFVSGGLSLFSYSMFALGFLFAAPVVVGFAVLIGMADTWLDLRSRAGELAA
jgi:hypothetical protein